MQAHMLGQVSGQVSNQVQSNGQLQGMNQRNGGAPSYPMQNHGVGTGVGVAGGNGGPSTLSMDPDFIRPRQDMQQRIHQILLRQQPQGGISQSHMQRIKDIIKRLEEGLFKHAVSKEDYLNLETLESRIRSLIKRSQFANRHQSPSSSVTTTMIPTPGMPHGGSSNAAAVTSSVDASTTIPSETQFPAVNGSFSNGYQQAAPANANFSVGSNNASSYSMPRMNSQMIPTPGFNNSGTNNNNYLNVDGSSNGGRFSTAESPMVPLVPHQNLHVRGFGSQQSNGALNNMLADANSPKTALHHFDQYQHPPPQDTSVGSMMNSQNTSLEAARSVLRPNTSLVTSHSNLPNTHHQGATSLRENFPSQRRQNHYQEQPRFFNGQQMQQNQQQRQFTEAFTMSQVTPDFQGQVKHEPGGGGGEDKRGEILHNQNNVRSTLSQGAQQMQKFVQPDQFMESPRMSSDLLSQVQWHPQSQNRTNVIVNDTSYEQHVKVEVGQRIYRQDVAQHNKGASDGNFTSGSTRETPHFNNGISRIGTTNRERQFTNQKRWLLFLRHARRCAAPNGKCQETNCITVQELLRHMENCKSMDCVFPRCLHTKVLIDHHRQCVDPSCPVCVPVKLFIQAQRKLQPLADSASSLANSVGGPYKPSDTTGVNSTQVMTSNNHPSMHGISEELMPPQKRIKADLPSQAFNHEPEKPVVSVSRSELLHPQVVSNQDQKQGETFTPIKKEVIEMRMGNFASFGQGRHNYGAMKSDDKGGISIQRADVESVKEIPNQGIPIDSKTDEVKQESEDQTAEAATSAKSGKPKVTGVSLTELFTPEQVREHIFGLRRWVGQSKSKAEKNQAMGHSMNENSCQLCAVEKLTFEPPPLYCTPCGSYIKRNAMFYTVGAGETRHCFCIPCYNNSRGDTIVADGIAIPKAKLEKKKNDEETEEWWVQCDKCEAWQHQICALFNGRRNDGGQAEYNCPNCYIEDVEDGKREPLPQSAVLGAKDLPRTILSDHIEQRLGKRLKQERLDRARLQGKAYDEVPGADGLVVRVVSSVDKKLEVKPRFLEIFQEENHPTEFPYKSKVVLLFQKIEGVEVCLFGMYVQEFGSECQFPNQRRVYLSYLDSVKYFRPEVRAATGEALRTFVYHEILIGYLEYCKLRGFTSCYIWACPPLKGEDYILYCHPEIQKTPKSDKLREWYLSMLKKATTEKIVVDLTNFYDHFFTSTGECKAKVTAARLPYFDGDYWPGAVEELIYQIRQEEEGKKPNKKGMVKKSITKRALKASGHDLSGNGSEDDMLMHKLGKTISPMKEDFIMVHLQHPCSHCCILMVSGNRWVCSICRNFQLCDKCYEAEQKCEDRERHPMYHREVHRLDPISITDVPEDTKDRDEILESEFFDTRQAFLSLCQGNHYQYDTLRRAKHSSMMVLYHLHNPTAPAFVSMCQVCHLDIEAGQGWRCEVCPEYEVCNNCYKKDGGVDHPHRLTNNPSTADRDAQNKEARQVRVSQLRKMLDLLVHASQCRSALCQYPNCRKVKGLFKHGLLCKTRASGGCPLCKKMWYLLQLHSRACKESGCHVPRCKDLKEHLRRLQQQSDNRRRAAVMEMMRQRAAEVTGSAG